MAWRKETIATVTFPRKPDWRYWPCVEANGKLVILGAADAWTNKVVARVAYRHVAGSSYELVGSKVIRRYDTKREAREAAKIAAREAKLARLRAKAFEKSVAAFAKRIGGVAALLDTEEYDDLVTAIYRVKIRRGKLALPWLLSDDAALSGAFVFALATKDRDHIAELGVVPAEDAADVARLVQSGCADDVVRTIAAIPDARITVASPTESVVAFLLPTPCKAIAKHARALHRLDSFAETTVQDLRAQLKRGDVFLWWD